MDIITARRITSGELLKYRKELRIARGYGMPIAGSILFALTRPYDAILDAGYEAWNRLVAQPETIMSIGMRDWAHGGQ
jgi:hypothetical protein